MGKCFKNMSCLSRCGRFINVEGEGEVVSSISIIMACMLLLVEIGTTDAFFMLFFNISGCTVCLLVFST